MTITITQKIKYDSGDIGYKVSNGSFYEREKVAFGYNVYFSDKDRDGKMTYLATVKNAKGVVEKILLHASNE